MDVEIWQAPSALDGIRIADGFGAIVRSDVLARVMRGNLAQDGFIVAALDGDTLVGYATTVPVAVVSSPEGRAFDRRFDLPDALELGAIEVARSWRRRGVASSLMRRFACIGGIERFVVLAHAMCRHWDTGACGLSLIAYRVMLVRLLSLAGFDVRHTDAPEVCDEPITFLAVRVGSEAPLRSPAALTARLILNEDRS